VTSGEERDLLTLEPLIEAVREGVERAGWELSGLQKTTSHQFEGRWEGESTRSAYLFFHSPSGPDWVSVDVYLDETSRGLTGNLALVADLVELGDLGEAEAALESLRAVSARELDARHGRPLTLRFRLSDADRDVVDAEVEVRFKVKIPTAAVSAGAAAISALATEVMAAFARILDSEELIALAPGHADEPPDLGGLPGR
jgi:hypothetical protein